MVGINVLAIKPSLKTVIWKKVGESRKTLYSENKKSDDFLRIGKLISNLGIPTLFVMEGGYDIEELGINVVNVLQSFDS